MNKSGVKGVAKLERVCCIPENNSVPAKLLVAERSDFRVFMLNRKQGLLVHERKSYQDS
jgi:hypothetical protein